MIICRCVLFWTNSNCSYFPWSCHTHVALVMLLIPHFSILFPSLLWWDFSLMVFCLLYWLLSVILGNLHLYLSASTCLMFPLGTCSHHRHRVSILSLAFHPKSSSLFCNCSCRQLFYLVHHPVLQCMYLLWFFLSLHTASSSFILH